MGKRAISLMAGVGMIVGGSVPMLWGDNSLFGGWSILLGLVGGLAGIWLGVWISKRYGD